MIRFFFFSAFAGNLWHWRQREEKRKHDLWAGERSWSRKLDGDEKLDIIQPLRRPWSVEVPTSWHYTHSYTGKRKKSKSPKRASNYALRRTSFSSPTCRHIHKRLFICTEVRSCWWTRGCRSLWDQHILHVPLTSKMVVWRERRSGEAVTMRIHVCNFTIL